MSFEVQEITKSSGKIEGKEQSMQVRIRPYKPADYDMIASWSDMPLVPGLLIEDGTFIMELNREPAATISVYTTNCYEVAYLEMFVGNPTLKADRAQFMPYLLSHAEQYTKNKGYKRLMCLAPHEKLTKRYKELGYRPTYIGLVSMTKELS